MRPTILIKAPAYLSAKIADAIHMNYTVEREPSRTSDECHIYAVTKSNRVLVCSFVARLEPDIILEMFRVKMRELGLARAGPVG